ncbi:TMEM175 family protein [Enterococcus faecalis]
MNKTRVEAFSDAVIAIIMTIMILEIKTPQVGVLAGLIENIPYFLSFIVSFIFICIAWYNHHYIMSVTHWFSKKAFWANNF